MIKSRAQLEAEALRAMHQVAKPAARAVEQSTSKSKTKRKGSK